MLFALQHTPSLLPQPVPQHCAAHAAVTGLVVRSPTCFPWHPLSDCCGACRSCRARLQRRKLPVRRSQTWTAGSRGTTSSSSSSAALQQQQAAQAQQLALLVKLQQQRLELEKQHQQMLLLQQQQQQQQQQHHHMRVALHPSPALSLASSSVSPEALAVLQQQQMLVEQAQLRIQALRAAGVSAFGNMANTAPMEVSVAGFGELSPGHTAPLASLGGLSNGSLTASATVASNGMHQAQLQDGAFAGATAPTAAAAAAALAGSSGWPFIGSAAAAGPAGASAAGLGTGLAETRSKSMGLLLLDSGNSLDAGVLSQKRRMPLTPVKRTDTKQLHGCMHRNILSWLLNVALGLRMYAAGVEGGDEVDLLGADDTFQTVEDVLNEEFAAALPGLDLMSGGHENAYMSHFGDERMLQGQQQQQLGTGTVPGARAHDVAAGLPAQAQLQHGGFLQAANSSARTVSFGIAPVAAQQVQLLQQMQPGERELHQQQLEQLMQTVQFLQARVKELSLQLGGPAPAGMPAPTAGSFGGM